MQNGAFRNVGWAAITGLLVGALAALEERRHTGKGKVIGCSLFDPDGHFFELNQLLRSEPKAD